jgi:hypothetical protein
MAAERQIRLQRANRAPGPWPQEVRDQVDALWIQMSNVGALSHLDDIDDMLRLWAWGFEAGELDEDDVRVLKCLCLEGVQIAPGRPHPLGPEFQSDPLVRLRMKRLEAEGWFIDD